MIYIYSQIGASMPMFESLVAKPPLRFRYCHPRRDKLVQGFSNRSIDSSMSPLFLSSFFYLSIDQILRVETPGDDSIITPLDLGIVYLNSVFLVILGVNTI